MDKETFEVLQSEMTKGFEQSIFIGAKKMIELSAKYVLTDTPNNASFKKGAEERLVRLLAYCFTNEQPVSSTTLIRILRESETDKDLEIFLIKQRTALMLRQKQFLLFPANQKELT